MLRFLAHIVLILVIRPATAAGATMGHGPPPPPAVATMRDLGVIAAEPAVQMRDGGYSVGVRGQSIWVFGDTILRHAPGEPPRVLSNSSTATSDLNAADGLNGFRERGAGGSPALFFPFTAQETAFNARHAGDNCAEPPCGARWAIWPGALLADAGGNRVYAFYHKIYAEPGVLNFRHRGHSVAVWQAPAGPVVRPRFDRYPDFPTLLLSGDRDGFGSAAVAIGDTAYIYGCEWRRQQGSNACHLARVPLADIPDWKAWTFRTADGTWSERVEDAAPLFEGNTMMSVFRDPGRRRYLAVYSEPLGLRVLARAAPGPAGPWSEPAVLFTAQAPVDGVGWVYDALAHPELSADGGACHLRQLFPADRPPDLGTAAGPDYPAVSRRGPLSLPRTGSFPPPAGRSPRGRPPG